MAAYVTIVDADVCIGLIWYALRTSGLHLFPAPTFRPSVESGASNRSNEDMNLLTIIRTF